MEAGSPVNGWPRRHPQQFSASLSLAAAVFLRARLLQSAFRARANTSERCILRGWRPGPSTVGPTPRRRPFPSRRRAGAASRWRRQQPRAVGTRAMSAGGASRRCIPLPISWHTRHFPAVVSIFKHAKGGRSSGELYPHQNRRVTRLQSASCKKGSRVRGETGQTVDAGLGGVALCNSARLTPPDPPGRVDILLSG